MITLTANCWAYGESGQYIARITGRDAKRNYKREFVGRKEGRRLETTRALVDEPGIYEVVEIDKKGRKDRSFALVVARPPQCPVVSDKTDPDWLQFWASEEDVMTLAKRLDAGEQFADMIECSDGGDKYVYAIRSKVEVKRASAATTIDSATEACWQVLQALPEREAKKVLATLKARVSPKPVAEPEPAASAQPHGQ